MGKINFLYKNGGPVSPIEERFWEKVDIRGIDECWLWLASVDEDGYGKFENTVAHRVSWELSFGKPDKGIYVLHQCDNRPCVNPSHLFLGTQYDNMQDMVRKGRINSRLGENNPKAKLTEKDIFEIYRLYNSGMSGYKIAKNFGVTQTCINYIVKGKSWKYLYEQVEHIR